MNHVFDRPEVSLVQIFEAPGISAINLLFHDALRGGQMASPRLDPLAKAMGQQVLEIQCEVPVSLHVVSHQARLEAALASKHSEKAMSLDGGVVRRGRQDFAEAKIG
jgi:hypothetical protein